MSVSDRQLLSCSLLLPTLDSEFGASHPSPYTDDPPSPQCEQRAPGGMAQSRPSETARLAIKSAGGSVHMLDLGEVITVKAQGNYVLLQEGTRSHMVRHSLEHMERILRPYGFVRIHRSVVVNSALVFEIESRPGGVYNLRTADKTSYTVSRTYVENLRQLACVWIGNIGFLSRVSDKYVAV